MESRHTGAVAAIDTDGHERRTWGDVERRYYFRSSAKPFQATASLEAGAALAPEQMAVACASHVGQPVHVALVRSVLAEAGLDESALRCPPAWPASEAAAYRLRDEGHRHPRPIWHNCSGKHAAMLSACAAQGWPIESYTDPGHPLQARVAELFEQVTGEDPGEPGIDGCGVPVFLVSTMGLAKAFARLAGDPRFRPAAQAMHRFPALTSDHPSFAARLATWLNAAAKGGAEANLGVAVFGRMGLGVKCDDGAHRGAEAGMFAALDELGLLVGEARHRLESALPIVQGGGGMVGRVRPVLEEP